MTMRSALETFDLILVDSGYFFKVFGSAGAGAFSVLNLLGPVV